MQKSPLILAAAAALWANAALAEPPQQPAGEAVSKDASIPFADFRGRIDDWRAEGRNAILIRSDTGQWYRAEFMSPCHGLPFSETVGFVLDGTRRVDKFGSIILRSAGGIKEECWFKSFVEIADPGKKAKAPAKQDDGKAGEGGHEHHSH